jgi:DNA-binding transcriptional ArsR family regulator
VPRRELHMLTIELARAYAGTERALSRDLNALTAMGLVERVRGARWRTREVQILAFRPLRRSPCPLE